MGYSNISSTSIGIWNQTPNGKINFGTNNSQRMTIDSVGNVGIGTLAPTDKLMISSNDGLSLSFKVAESVNYAEIQTNKSGGSNLILQKLGGGVGIGTNAPLGKFHVNNDVSGSDSSFVVTTGGNVGIGTANPIGKFEVKSSSSYSRKGQIVLDPGVFASPEGGTDVYNWIRSEYVNNTPWDLGLGGTAYNSGFPQVMIKRNGFVGIGTINPDRPLSIESAQYNPLRLKSLTDGCYVELFTPGYLSASQRAGWIGYGSSTSKSFDITNQISSGSIKLRTNNLDRVTVDSTGNVGIGTNVPSAKLDVAGTVKIADGTQGAGKVLTSDASGKATWQTAAVSTGSFTNMQVYATAGTNTFTVPAGVTKIMIEVWGGGGGGGASGANPGSPAGGGGYGKDIITVTPGTAYTVTVGAAGVQGTSGASGTTGGTTSVGTLISATGGAGGGANCGGPGWGGSSTARINVAGQRGQVYGSCSTGVGGSSPNGGYGTNWGGGFPGAGGAGSQVGAVGQVIIWY
jgi:hypothetical protein